ncbi:hypothetical protein AB2M62_08370 [Sphingomonas sp. MMS12-HWE2-04]|uniref:hypothetical protein n=1 Tax=Sphingomonas sp. MMS12-HWE2-04 TaxID=3234199 RepID=UPI0038513F53
MADTNTPNSNGAEGVTFDADPTLEAKAGAGSGPAAINFEADDTAGGGKRTASQQIKDEASKFTSQAADRAREFAGQGKERATGALDEVAKMMSSAADDVDSRLGEEYGRYARSAADSVTGFADALRGKEVDDLIDDATAFVRKSPVIAVGTAAAVGFVLARLIKSGFDAAGNSSAGTPKA